VLHKFNDLDSDGSPDTGEPPLVGIRFDIRVGDEVYPVETDAQGMLRLCLPEGAEVSIDELVRASGGLWQMTTDRSRLKLRLHCGENAVWIGNAELQLPRTGVAGLRRRGLGPVGVGRIL
jgi:hypothetical protein